MSVIVTLLITVAILSAIPVVRERHHNVFEHHHRFAGWTGLIITWVFVILSCMQVPVLSSSGAAEGVEWKWDAAALVHSQQFWFTLFITILTFTPWSTVRKVPVEVTTVGSFPLLLFAFAISGPDLFSPSLLPAWR